MSGVETAEIMAFSSSKDGQETGTRPVGATEEREKPRHRGRPKGIPNKVNRIAKEAILDAEPHSFLIRVMEGRKFKRAGTDGARATTECYPTLGQSIGAAETLLRKIAPDMKAQEITGADGERLLPESPRSDLDTARAVAFLLNRAAYDAGKPMPQTDGMK